MPDPEFFEKPRFCSQCGNPIVVEEASFCKDCGTALDRTRAMRREDASRTIIALLLSLIPGLGHVYLGRTGAGIGWFFGVILAYSAGPIGFLLHLICAISAASQAARQARFRSRRDRRRGGPISQALRN